MISYYPASLLCSFRLSGVLSRKFCRLRGGGEAKMEEEMNAISILSISSLSLLIKITFPERFLLNFYPWKASLKF